MASSRHSVHRPCESRFDFLVRCPSGEAAELLRDETPGVVAIALAHLDAQSAGFILGELDTDKAVLVSLAWANLGLIPARAVDDVERRLRRKLSAGVEGGAGPVMAALSVVPVRAQDRIVAALRELDPGHAEMHDGARSLVVSLGTLVLTFEDLACLDSRSMQRVIRELHPRELAIALQAATQRVRRRVLENMSDRAAQLLDEEMELALHSSTVEIEEAQEKIASIIRQLEDSFEIFVDREGSDAVA